MSAYPLFMGGRMVVLSLKNGGISPEDYARYVIPYTAICMAILIVVALQPVFFRLGVKSGWMTTLVGLGLFAAIEAYMESITIYSAKFLKAVEWQLLSCIGTTSAIRAFQKPFTEAFKIHYFLVSFVIIALVISLVYGYGRQIAVGERSNRVQLRMQLISVVLLLGLCIFANFTGFFRDTNDYLSPLSAFLTGLFFVVLSVTAGIYAASFSLGKSKVISVGLPAVSALAVCSIMYYGEYKLLDNHLYHLGKTAFFEGLPYIALSVADIGIILASGLITMLLMCVVWGKESVNLECRGRSV